MTFYGRLLTLALIPAALTALDTKAARQSLKGLTGFVLEVEDVGAKTKPMGVDPAKIKANIESKLKGAGIKILSVDEGMKAPGSPHLSLNLDSLVGKDGTVAFELTLSVLQGCTLARDSSMKVPACITWSRGRVGRANDKPAAFIDTQVAAELDTFLKAYAEGNPK
jgi:hypothetical protein